MAGEDMMTKKTGNKLRSQAGESIAETLFALLIAALALVMLAGAITTSARIITQSRNKLDAYYSANESDSGVVKMSGSGTRNTVQIRASDLSQDAGIMYYQNTAFGQTPVTAYKYVPPTPSPSPAPAPTPGGG